MKILMGTKNPGKIEGYVYISPEHDNALDVLKKANITIVNDNNAFLIKFNVTYIKMIKEE